MIRRAMVLGYGIVAYVGFVAVLGYTIGFLANVGVPKGVDGGPAGPAALAVLVDVALLGLFGVSHSVMARPWFKLRWTRLVPPAIERSTYVLVADLTLGLTLWLWRPLATPVWSVHASWARALLWTVHLAGWGLVVLSSFLIGHWDLFGMRQVLARWRGRRYAEPVFREPWLYRLVRNPLLLGFLVAFWATPDMSAGRMLFVGVASAYILVAVRFEEHDLSEQLGEAYQSYLDRVPRFVPRPSVLVGRDPAPHRTALSKAE
jgi:protein-S-isoprenylcysteine O-methyltransferase Ste14